MSTRFKYFPAAKSVETSSLHLCDVGWQQTSLDADYPIRQHPDGYYYTWEMGRRLAEYQLGFIFSGKGVVEFKRGTPIPLAHGTLLLLAPGAWHRCKPDATTGWGTLWIGFNGKMAQEIVSHIFHADGYTVKTIAKAKEFKYAAMRFIAQVFKHGDSKPHSIIGELTLLLGRLADGEFDDTEKQSGNGMIRNAQYEISRRYADIIDFKALARSLGSSYDAFRHRFAAETGLSPLQFQLSEKLRVAKNLVANSNMPIQEIARRTGFSSAAYFTRFFKATTRMPPIEYRNAQSTMSS